MQDVSLEDGGVSVATVATRLWWDYHNFLWQGSGNADDKYSIPRCYGKSNYDLVLQ